MDTGLIFLGTEQAVEHVPGRPEHVLDGDPLTNVWRNVVHPSGKMHAGVWDCRAGTFELPCHASLPKAPPRLKTRRAARRW
jgi:uncharacterized cupin superfamily protein